MLVSLRSHCVSAVRLAKLGMCRIRGLGRRRLVSKIRTYRSIVAALTANVGVFGCESRMSRSSRRSRAGVWEGVRGGGVDALCAG